MKLLSAPRQPFVGLALMAAMSRFAHLQARNRRTGVCEASLRRMGADTLVEDNDARRSRGNNQRSAAGYHASENDALGAIWIAFPLCDGGVGSRNGVGSVFHSSHNKTLGGKLAQAALRHLAWNPHEHLMLLV